MDPINAHRPNTLHLKSTHLEEMRAWVSALAPEEGCGLLVGHDGTVFQIVGIENELHSPWRYRMQPYQQLRAFQSIDEQGWEMLGIFHSHPTGPPEPSPTDIAESYYPEAIHMIWSLNAGQWVCRAFTISGSNVNPVSLILVSGE